MLRVQLLLFLAKLRAGHESGQQKPHQQSARTTNQAQRVILSEATDLHFASPPTNPEVSDNGANPSTRAAGASAHAASTTPHI
jgi:hypothetical protein